MSNRSAAEIAQAFLDVIWAEEPPSDKALLVAIDRLLAAAHDVPQTDGIDHDLDPPKRDWNALYDELGGRFPGYGFYSMADPLAVDGNALLTGDAIDDLADLTSDLREVVWRSANAGSNDGAWYFHLMREIHWAQHARELALFLSARISAGAE